MDALKAAYGAIMQNAKAHISGYVCCNTADLAHALVDKRFPNDYIFADISMGVWRSNHVASEFFAQLGGTNEIVQKKPLSYQQPVAASNNYLFFGDVAGEGIDAESKGDATLTNNLDYVQIILDKLEAGDAAIVFAVIMPVTAAGICYDNELFIYLFALAVAKTKHKLIAISTGNPTDVPLVDISWEKIDKSPLSDVPDSEPGNGINYLLPGIIDAKEVADDTGFIRLKQGYLLVPVERRKPVKQIDKLKFDKLASLYKGNEHIRAYSLYNGNTYFLDGDFLARYAWKQFGKGGREIAFQLLSKVYSCARNSTEKAVVQCQLQGLRIALWKFTEVTQETMPSSAIPVAMRRFLLLARGWGAVMTGALDLATECLGTAVKLFTVAELQSKEYMYLLNVNALLLLKKGEAEQAMDLEKKIEHAIKTHGINDHRLVFVNSINIARLYKKNKQPADSLAYYLKAFQTIYGLKQESDLVYCNLILSFAYSDLGDHGTSFTFLLRSVLNLLCSASPQFSSKRLYVAMGRHGMVQEGAPSIEEMYSYFAAQLCNHRYFSDHYSDLHSENAELDTAPCFLNSSLFSGDISEGIGCSGISVFVSQEEEPGLYHTAQLPLQVITYKILRKLFKNAEAFEAAKTIIVDTNNGFDIPASFDEFIAVSERLHVKSITWNDEHIAVLRRASFWEKTKVSLHPGIKDVIEREHTIDISFKRYYPPVTLTGELLSVFRRIYADPLTLSEIHEDKKIAAAQVARLEAMKLVKQTVNHQEICKEAGFKLHLSAT